MDGLYKISNRILRISLSHTSDRKIRSDPETPLPVLVCTVYLQLRLFDAVIANKLIIHVIVRTQETQTRARGARLYLLFYTLSLTHTLSVYYIYRANARKRSSVDHTHTGDEKAASFRPKLIINKIKTLYSDSDPPNFKIDSYNCHSTCFRLFPADSRESFHLSLPPRRR